MSDVETLTHPFTCNESEVQQEDRKEESEYTYEEGKNYWSPLVTLSKIIPSPVESERHTQARKFIEEKIPVGCLTLCETELFIENDLFPYFSIALSSRIATIIRKHYNEKCKEAKENKKREERKKASENDFDIAEEFKGLYKIEIDDRSGKPIMRAKFIDIAIKVIDTLNVIVFKDNIYCYQDGYYQNNPKRVKAEATRILNGIYKGINSGDIKRHLVDVMTDIEHYNPVNDYPFKGVKNAINVLNGVLIFDEKTGELKREDPDPEKYRFNYILQIEYNENAERDTIINELDKYTNKPRAIIQIIAQALLQSMGYEPFKLAYLLYLSL